MWHSFPDATGPSGSYKHVSVDGLNPSDFRIFSVCFGMQKLILLASFRLGGKQRATFPFRSINFRHWRDEFVIVASFFVQNQFVHDDQLSFTTVKILKSPSPSTS